MPLPFSHLCIKLVAIPSTAFTAGTRFTVAHGLGYAPKINAIVAQSQDADDDNDNAQAFAVIKADSTNVTLKPTRTKTSQGNLMIFLETDVGGRNFAR